VLKVLLNPNQPVSYYGAAYRDGLIAVLGAIGQAVRAYGQHVSRSIPYWTARVGVWPARRLCHSRPGRLRQAGARSRGGHAMSEPRDHARTQRESPGADAPHPM